MFDGYLNFDQINQETQKYKTLLQISLDTF